mmetsp:Transcript_21762/g.61938  ORF Transcript_21762/g.61938 Transcript_21762/m.61938 type:complete len:295 (+) Transcript_21762:147-1031(+)
MRLIRNRFGFRREDNDNAHHASPPQTTKHESATKYAYLIVQRDFFAILSACLTAFILIFHFAPGNLDYPGICAMTYGTFHGDQYFSSESGSIGSSKCLIESKWMKVSQHTVKIPGTQEILKDWLWIDYHDRVNILVEEAVDSPGEEERRFLIFRQSKYALEGQLSLAIVGGIIEPGEDAESAARREVDEEMGGIVCEKFHFLGRYRTDVNRGMGWLNSFHATGCKKNPNHVVHQYLPDEVGAADSEKQEIVSVTLSQLREAVTKSKFMEAQWSATVALSLLREEEESVSKQRNK